MASQGRMTQTLAGLSLSFHGIILVILQNGHVGLQCGARFNSQDQH